MHFGFIRDGTGCGPYWLDYGQFELCFNSLHAEVILHIPVRLCGNCLQSSVVILKVEVDKRASKP